METPVFNANTFNTRTLNMKTNFLFCSLFIFLNCTGQFVDSVRAKILYNYYTKDSSTQVKESEHFVLTIGNLQTKYFSYTKYKTDSLIREAVKKGQSLNSISSISTNNTSATIIYRKLVDNTFKLTTELVGDKYCYPDKFDISWNILDDTMLIQGYSCQKAVLDFRGRHYVAWFTNSIPVSAGPWKFYGLPGLIMNLYDKDRSFYFECVGINIFNNTKELLMIEDKGCIETTRERYYKQEDLYYQDPIEYLRNVKGYNFVITGGPEIKKRPAPLRLELN